MQKLTLGDKIAGLLSCLSDHYVHQDADADSRLVRPSACNGCDQSEICHRIRMVIRIEKLHEKIYRRKKDVKS